MFYYNMLPENYLYNTSRKIEYTHEQIIFNHQDLTTNHHNFRSTRERARGKINTPTLKKQQRYRPV